MKLEPSISPAHSSRRCPPSLPVAALLVLLSACGSPAEQASQPDATTPASRGSAGQGAGAPAATAAGGSATTSATPAPATELPPPAALVPAADGAAGAADGAGSVEPLTADACADPGADACGACVCDQCSAELAACSSVEGCVEILACVRASGCSGRDCYCGSASLTDCLAGEAQGPCADVVLRAPGASTPTLQAPSAGPASDASLRVADCAQARDTCRDVCGAGD